MSQHDLRIGYQPALESLEARRAECRRLVCELARSYRQYCRTASERSRVDEIVRGRALGHDGLELLCELAARSDVPSALEELVRTLVIQRIAAPVMVCPYAASEAEQQVNALLDMAQLLAAKEKTPTRWQQVREFGIRQIEVTRTLVDATAPMLRLAR